MNTQIQQLQAEGRIDSEDYRTVTLCTLLIKLVMAMIMGVLVVCGMMVT